MLSSFRYLGVHFNCNFRLFCHKEKNVGLSEVLDIFILSLVGLEMFENGILELLSLNFITLNKCYVTL